MQMHFMFSKGQMLLQNVEINVRVSQHKSVKHIKSERNQN